MAQAAVPAKKLLTALVQVARPREWIKNSFVFAALVFAGHLRRLDELLAVMQAFAGFCFFSSAVYAFNDVMDAEEDRRHPVKRNRPLASGALTPGTAIGFSLACVAAGCALCVLAGPLGPALLLVGLAYLFLNLFYTLRGKKHMLVDVICIAIGFVLRASAGGVVIGVLLSRWLLACTFALCMFLGFAKRRCEIAQLGGRENAGSHRRTLGGYDLSLLDHLLSVSGGVAVVTYLVYSIGLPDPFLFWSTPLVVFCVFRVSMLVMLGHVSGPTEAVTRDKPFLAAFGLWCVYAVAVVTWADPIRAWLDATTRWLGSA